MSGGWGRPIDAVREVNGEMNALASALQRCSPQTQLERRAPAVKHCGTMTDALPRPHKRHVPGPEERANVIFVVKQSKPEFQSK